MKKYNYIINENGLLDEGNFYDFNSSNKQYNNPCENCPNNPKNNPFSSGFCSCALPALYNPIY